MSALLHQLRTVIYPDICPVCMLNKSDQQQACDSCREELVPHPAPWCTGCGGTIDGALEICHECLRRDRPWQHAVSVYPFAGMVRQLIHRFKYQGQVSLTKPLATATIDAWHQRRGSTLPDLVVPVPLHWFKECRRGYNQTELIARVFSEQTGIPLMRTLYRQQHTKPQARLNLSQREQNLKRAFATRLDIDLTGKCVLLIDDVLTTGSTLGACTRQLLAAGTKRVDVITIARG